MKPMEQQDNDAQTPPDEVQTASTATIEQRLGTLEGMILHSISRIDGVQHLVELLLNEALARRQTNTSRPETASLWSPAGFPFLPRNYPVHFGTERPFDYRDAQDYLASGWYDMEPWGIWGRDTVQTLRFALEEHHGGYVTVHLTLLALIPLGGNKVNVDISANGYFLGSFRVGPLPQLVQLRLPPSCVDGGDILLQLRPETTHSPASIGLAPDGRILGVGLVSLDVS
ncbi:hypothetical protein MOK15_00205 [Sphingobium sp. BYY-5]|uniref:hypothetical protein n=1 Tax=Sphingobium sp. BYY-5 TaxID=2926400 RepID=UPI001FA6D70B|nr:hypothetical protein [Sphingobium sp. BYY-5]MCI4588530.1 hypothetical protein [Sphingobium sp. BYY-5]